MGWNRKGQKRGAARLLTPIFFERPGTSLTFPTPPPLPETPVFRQAFST
jgi:hypothetical protein